jgi:hypothetical protein
VFRVLEPALRMKAQADSTPKDFICREEKRKTAWWGLGFIAFFCVYCLRAEMPFRCRWAVPGEKCSLSLNNPPFFDSTGV